MMKSLTDTRLLAIGLTAVVIFSVVGAILAPEPDPPPLSIHRDKADGAMALYEWLQSDSRYDVRELTSDTVNPTGLDVLLILSPGYEYTDGEAQVMAEWVKRGGTLIVVGNLAMDSLLEQFNLDINIAARADNTPFYLSSPTLTHPPVEALLLRGWLFGIQTERTDIIPHLVLNTEFEGIETFLVSFPEGEGQVWVSGTFYPFTNLGIQDDPNAKLILNLLADAPTDAVIGIDEAQHYSEAGAPQSLNDWFFSTSAGWSILTAFGLVMLFFGLRGRRFGRTIPLREERLLREPVEYIQAMAGLLRRSGQRGETVAHYRAQLRRALSKRYALDPSLNEEALLKAIQSRDAQVNLAELRGLLVQLNKTRVSEADLVTIASQVDEWIGKLR